MKIIQSNLTVRLASLLLSFAYATYSAASMNASANSYSANKSSIFNVDNVYDSSGPSGNNLNCNFLNIANNFEKINYNHSNTYSGDSINNLSDQRGRSGSQTSTGSIFRFDMISLTKENYFRKFKIPFKKLINSANMKCFDFLFLMLLFDSKFEFCVYIFSVL